MPGAKMIGGIVAIVVLIMLAIFLTPAKWSILGMKGKAAFIGAHTTASIEDSSDVGYMKLRDYLHDHGYELVQLQAPRIRLEELQQYDACIMFPPSSALDKNEIDALHKYVENGGGLLICGEGWALEKLEHLNNITKDWGFLFMNTKVYEPEQTQTDYGVSVSQYTVAALGLVEGNPIASRITYPYIMRNSCTINITDPNKVTKAITLKGYAFGENYYHQDLKPTKGHGEPVGEDAVVMVTGQIGQGRVVGMGGHDLYMNKWIFQSKPAENAKSMVYILDWLTKYT